MMSIPSVESDLQGAVDVSAPPTGLLMPCQSAFPLILTVVEKRRDPLEKNH